MTEANDASGWPSASQQPRHVGEAELHAEALEAEEELER